MSNQFNILVVDPAEHTGYALVKIDIADNSADIFEYGIIDMDNSGNYLGDACNQMFDHITAIIEKHQIKQVVVEDYFFSGKFANGSNMNPMYRAAVHMAARRKNLPTEILNVSQWKSFVAGRSTPTKQQKAKWGAESAKKLFIQEALWTRFGIRFPNHSISQTTGKPIVFRFDIVDAVAQAICYTKLHMGLLAVTCSVPVPPDVVFKRPSKKIFTYPPIEK
jgi:Holliday junction resolvasome RuvABC endonuclease subunit